MGFQGPFPFLPTDGADAHFQSLWQPFEQQRQQEVLFTSPSTSALLPTSSYSIDQSLLVDMTISVASLMQTFQEEIDRYLQLQVDYSLVNHKEFLSNYDLIESMCVYIYIFWWKHIVVDAHFLILLCKSE